MESSQKPLSPQCPSWVVDVIRMLMNVHHSANSKRIRIAVTAIELAEYREWCFAKGDKNFTNAIQAYPCIVEEHPTDPMYLVEMFL